MGAQSGCCSAPVSNLAARGDCCGHLSKQSVTDEGGASSTSLLTGWLAWGVRSNSIMPEPKAALAVEPRVAFLNAPDKNQHLIATKRYARNVIVTSKYTVVSFVPKTIFEFFRITANIYFLVISLLQVRQRPLTNAPRWSSTYLVCRA